MNVLWYSLTIAVLTYSLKKKVCEYTSLFLIHVCLTGILLIEGYVS